MTAAEAMVAATARLRAAGVPDPARDARVLLAHAARVDATRVTLIAPEDIAPVVRFLASDAAGFITGEVISVSGGYRL